MPRITWALCLILFSANLRGTAAGPSDDWQQLTTVGGGTQSQMQPSHWPYDKYPNIPEVTPHSKTLLLDVDGPGVVTLIHASKYVGGDEDKAT